VQDDERAVPADRREQRQNGGGYGDGEDAAPDQITAAPPAPQIAHEEEERDGAGGGQNIAGDKDLLDLLKMDAPVVRHRQRRELQRTEEKRAVVVDKRVIIQTHFFRAHPRLRRDIERRHVAVIQRAEIDRYHNSQTDAEQRDTDCGQSAPAARASPVHG